MHLLQYFLLFTVFIVGLDIISSCDVNESRYGCRIQNGRCNCGVACIDKTYFTSKAACLSALKGARRDICSMSPCENLGECLKVTQEPGYKCRCEGTGFYGLRCSKPCPSASDVTGAAFPHECIVI